VKAIERNLAELQRAQLNRTTLEGLASLDGFSSLLPMVIYTALFNDYIAHCMKVFERSGKSASFWYLYRTHQGPIDTFAKKERIDIGSLEVVSARLKEIRNLTHFHIDANSVMDHKAVWRSAELKGKELSGAVNAAWKIVDFLRAEFGVKEVFVPDYYSTKYVAERFLSMRQNFDE